MFSSEIPLVSRGVNFKQFTNLIARNDQKDVIVFKVRISSGVIRPAQYKNKSSTKRRLFRVLYCFKAPGGFGNAYYVCPGHLLDYLTAFAQTKERK